MQSWTQTTPYHLPIPGCQFEMLNADSSRPPTVLEVLNELPAKVDLHKRHANNNADK